MIRFLAVVSLWLFALCHSAFPQSQLLLMGVGGASGGGGTPSLGITGPTSGTVSVASTNFTITLTGSTFNGSRTVTIADGSQGGTFTPSVGSPGTSTVTVTPVSGTTFTFTYTPAVTGAITLTTTNAQSWSNPSPWTYTSSAGGATTTFDATFNASNLVISNGNLTLAGSSAGGGVQVTGRSVASHSTGKFYAEITTAGNFVSVPVIGIINGSIAVGDSDIGFDGTNNSGANYSSTADFFINSNAIGSTITLTSGDTFGIAFDAGGQLFWIKDITAGGNWNGSGTANPATGVGGISTSLIACACYLGVAMATGGSVSFTANFGATGYAATPPAGFGNW